MTSVRDVVYLNIVGARGGVTSLAGQTGILTLASIGLGNVDNTSDANKPISTATQTALNLKASTASLSLVNAAAFNRWQARPGDAPQQYVTALTGGDPDSLARLGDGAVATVTNIGRVGRISGAGIIAMRGMFAIDDDTTYVPFYEYRRQTDTSDPANDDVRLGIAWYDATRAQLAGDDAQTIVYDNTTLDTTDGIIKYAAEVARTATSASTIIPPETAVYGRVFVQTFGTVPVTDILVLDFFPAALSGVFIDQSQVTAALAALASPQLQGKSIKLPQFNGYGGRNAYLTIPKADMPATMFTTDSVIIIRGWIPFERAHRNRRMGLLGSGPDAQANSFGVWFEGSNTPGIAQGKYASPRPCWRIGNTVHKGDPLSYNASYSAHFFYLALKLDGGVMNIRQVACHDVNYHAVNSVGPAASDTITNYAETEVLLGDSRKVANKITSSSTGLQAPPDLAVRYETLAELTADTGQADGKGGAIYGDNADFGYYTSLAGVWSKQSGDFSGDAAFDGMIDLVAYVEVADGGTNADHLRVVKGADPRVVWTGNKIKWFPLFRGGDPYSSIPNDLSSFGQVGVVSVGGDCGQQSETTWLFPNAWPCGNGTEALFADGYTVAVDGPGNSGIVPCSGWSHGVTSGSIEVQFLNSPSGTVAVDWQRVAPAADGKFTGHVLAPPGAYTRVYRYSERPDIKSVSTHVIMVGNVVVHMGQSQVQHDNFKYVAQNVKNNTARRFTHTHVYTDTPSDLGSMRLQTYRPYAEVHFADGVNQIYNQYAKRNSDPLHIVQEAVSGTGQIAFITDSDTTRNWSGLDDPNSMDSLVAIAGADGDVLHSWWTFDAPAHHGDWSDLMDGFFLGIGPYAADHYILDRQTFRAKRVTIMLPQRETPVVGDGPNNSDTDPNFIGVVREATKAWVALRATTHPGIFTLGLECTAHTLDQHSGPHADPDANAGLRRVAAHEGESLNLMYGRSNRQQMELESATLSSDHKYIDCVVRMPHGGKLTTYQNSHDSALYGFEISENAGSAWLRPNITGNASSFVGAITGDRTFRITKNASGTFTSTPGQLMIRIMTGGPLTYGILVETDVTYASSPEKGVPRDGVDDIDDGFNIGLAIKSLQPVAIPYTVS